MTEYGRKAAVFKAIIKLYSPPAASHGLYPPGAVHGKDKLALPRYPADLPGMITLPYFSHKRLTITIVQVKNPSDVSGW